ncbi:hypothetical protein CIK70_08070 [Brachybacterium alimentarium]|uniref:hypothetical protein n=1 Tax=Brachybacterium alimentarium TaxID=47845 RepID=UPI000DF13183|nr:hypothetical protein [Brachybacterium alimentarium]RCS79276.1 hypothetical protein CIK70_08070 [Brachybacterium alimentarium]
MGRHLFDPAALDQIAVGGRVADFPAIQGKSGTNYASRLSSPKNVEATLSDEKAVFPVVLVLARIHRLDGRALSVPCVANHSGAHPVAQSPFSKHEMELLHHSADSLRVVATGLRG